MLMIPLFYFKSEAVAQRCSVKKKFLEISQNSRENTCVRVSYNKVAGWGNGYDKELHHERVKDIILGALTLILNDWNNRF